MWRLIWVCALLLCPIYGTLCLNGLISKDTRVVISVYATYIKSTILATFDIKFIRQDQNNIEMAGLVGPVRRVSGRV